MPRFLSSLFSSCCWIESFGAFHLFVTTGTELWVDSAQVRKIRVRHLTHLPDLGFSADSSTWFAFLVFRLPRALGREDYAHPGSPNPEGPAL